MPNTKQSIYNLGLERPGKLHSLTTYNSQAKQPVNQQYTSFGSSVMSLIKMQTIVEEKINLAADVSH